MSSRAQHAERSALPFRRNEAPWHADGCGPIGVGAQIHAAAVIRSIFQMWRCENGSVALEFGMIAIPLLMGSLGIIEFGRTLWMRNAMERQIDMVERSILILERPSKNGEPYIRTEDGREILKTRLKGDFSLASVGAPEKITRNGVDYVFSTITVTHNVNLLIPFFDYSRVTMTVQRKVPVAE